MEFLVFLARILFSALFIQSGIGHMTAVDDMSQYAQSKDVPAPKASVFLSGVIILLGGLSVLLGWWVSVGGLLLVLFLVPTAFIMHDFWNAGEPMERQNERIHFMKDLALAGAAFLIWYLYITVEHVPWSIG